MSLDFPLIIADESVDYRIVTSLLNNGFEVFSISKECPGLKDSEVIELAVEKNGFILTEDKDFGDELVYKRDSRVGGLLLRLSDQPISNKIHLIHDVFSKHLENLNGNFSVLSAKKLRIRKYDSH